MAAAAAAEQQLERTHKNQECSVQAGLHIFKTPEEFLVCGL